jgi:hypothetical protein
MAKTIETFYKTQAAKDAHANATFACAKFNTLLGDPINNLIRLEKSGFVSISSLGVESQRDVQDAFFALADQIKYDKLRFCPGMLGSAHADFTLEGDDGDTAWRARLCLDREPVPPAKWEIVLMKK